MAQRRDCPPFGAWVRQRRLSLDLTQDELGLRLGCSGDTIRKIELGERRPSRQIAELLAEWLLVAEDEREAFVLFARGRVPYMETARAMLQA